MTKMSSRGQIVIPKDLRKNLEVGTPFLVSRKGDMLMLKKMSISKAWQELDRMFKENRKKVRESGLKESDVMKIVEKFRREKRQI